MKNMQKDKSFTKDISLKHQNKIIKNYQIYKGISDNRDLAKRSCLKCGKMFNSLGKGNRICPKCSSEKE